MSGDIPAKTKGLYLNKHVSGLEEKELAEGVEVKEIDTPQPKEGQVLVQVHSSPVNPADLMTLQGKYASAPPVPHALGREGSGVVVKSGGGEKADKLVGKRAAFSLFSGDLPTALWSEYAVVSADACLLLPDDVSFDQGCALFVNPLTCMSFVQIAVDDGHDCILLTAAASALSKMVIKYSKRKGVRIIGIVRHTEQKDELKKLGAIHVVDTSVDEKEWSEELKKVCKENNCRLAFDAVGGDMPKKLLAAMPPKSSVKVYGGLSGQEDVSSKLSDVLFGEKNLGGFWLEPYFQSRSDEQKKDMLEQTVKYAKEDFAFGVAQHTSLQNFNKSVGAYAKQMSKGKVLVHPNESKH